MTSSIIGACGLLAFSGGVAAVPVLASTSPAAPTVVANQGGVAVNSAPAWLTKAMPFVHVKNYAATIDPTLARVLTAGELATVQADVHAYNAAPITTRTIGVTHEVTISLSMAATLNYSACVGSIRVHSYNWWGVQFYLNSCFAEDLAYGVALAAVASGLLFLVPGINVLVVVLIAMLGAASGSIAWADHHCNYNGVYLNVPWVPAAVWGSSIC